MLYARRFDDILEQKPNCLFFKLILVRQLAPSSNGLPLEIYVFANDTDWGRYESIQADIFDHLLAALSAFELRVFQHPTGFDMKNIIGTAEIDVDTNGP